MSSENTPQEAGHILPSRPESVTSGSWATYEPPLTDSWAGQTFPHARTTYQPTSEQLARDEQRRRYLRRNVYAPVLIAAVLVLGLFALIIALAFGVGTPQAMSLIAGLSALTIILISIPLIAIMSVLPIAWAAFTLNRRRQRRNYPETGPTAYRGRLQIVLWQLESVIDGARGGVEGLAARLRRPLIALHARVAYWRELIRELRENFSRSI